MKTTAVKKQARAAEKLHEEVYGDKSLDDKTKNADLASEQTSAEQAKKEADGTPPVPAEPVAAATDDGAAATVITDAPPLAVVPPVEQGKDWEHKYNTLQGMFNAAIPKLNGQLAEAQSKITSLEAVIASLKSGFPATAEAGSVARSSTLLSEEEVADYGPDMIDVVKRAAREEFGPELKRLQDENTTLRSQVGDVAATTAGDVRTQLFTTLAAQVPNWQTLNQDQNFIAWLSEIDAFSGAPRQDMLNSAFEANDSPRVIAFFQKYQSETNVVSPANDQNAAAAPPTVNLDTLVAPGPASAQSGNAPAQNDANGKIYSALEVQAFYSDVQKGRFKNDPAGKTRLETAIIKAGREGRIR
tara:strand:+ start:6792 stop:7865 length:1074 start_codon:yes stop_codon:yes gene_type:complete